MTLTYSTIIALPILAAAAPDEWTLRSVSEFGAVGAVIIMLTFIVLRYVPEYLKTQAISQKETIKSLVDSFERQIQIERSTAETHRKALEHLTQSIDNLTDSITRTLKDRHDAD